MTNVLYQDIYNQISEGVTLQKKSFALALLVILCFSPIYLANTIAENATFFITPIGEQMGGVPFTVPTDGVYRFTILQGAYNPWPDSVGSHNIWRNAVYFYINRAIEWTIIWEPIPTNPDFSLGSLASYSSYQEAEAAGIGQYIDVSLNAGDIVRMIAPDGQSGYWGNGCQGGVTIEISYLQLEPPTVLITDARMVSPNELGIGAIAAYPASCPDGATTTFTISGIVNGQAITKSISIPQSGNPGGEWGRMVSTDINGKVLPSTPLRINLLEQGVQRFTKNEDFTVEVAAAYEGSSQSILSTKTGQILLPVIIIHGVTTNWVEDTIYPVVYSGLEDSLVKNGYIPDDEGYKTLWKVNEITYSSQDDTEQVVAAKIEGYINVAIAKTYAAKINIIGHSLGGLIGRFVTTEYEAIRVDGPRVNKLIMVGTPNQGSTDFYERAFSMTRTQAINLLTSSTMQPNLRQWLSPVYSSALYSKVKNTQIEISDPNALLSTDCFTNRFYSNGYNKPAPSDVTYFSIFNTNEKKLSTPYAVSVVPTKDGQWCIYKHTMTSGPGDGTVLAESANTPYAISMPVNARTGHGGLASDPMVIQQILNCLIDS